MSEPFLGEIKIIGFNFAPRGWTLCDGQILPINQNTALFSLLGTTFGGDGRTTFGLPDLRGRAGLGVGHGPGLSNRTWGQKGGSETNILNTNNLPSHQHSFAVPAVAGAAGESEPASNHVLAEADIYSGATPDETLKPANTGLTGGGQAVNNMQPYLALYFAIALVGIFPSRN